MPIELHLRLSTGPATSPEQNTRLKFVILYFRQQQYSKPKGNQTMSFKPFDGYLFKVLGAIGTRSEGPIYYIQALAEWNESDITSINVIRMKKNPDSPWAEDHTLNQYIGTKVTVEGVFEDDRLAYSSIKPYKLPDDLGGAMGGI